MTGTAIKGSAVLFSEMTPAPGDEDRFNDWYDNHHTPNHVTGVPGFLSAHRYAAPDGPGYLAVYELDGPETLESPEYRSRKYTPDDRTRAMLSSVSGFTRYVAREIDFGLREDADIGALNSPYVLAVFFAVPEGARPEFEDWYRTEHMGMLLACRDWRLARMMAVVAHDPDPFTHMMLHYVRRPDILDAPEVRRARDTEWRNRLAAEDWWNPRFATYRKRGRRFLKTDSFPDGGEE